MPSVLQNWVMELPLRAQGTLLTGIRGCDVTPKLASDASKNTWLPERQLAAFLRYCILVPADEREVGVYGAWFSNRPPNFKSSQLGHYPMHWYSHVMHCFEVVGYLHPHGELRDAAWRIYAQLVENLHLNRESKEDMMARFTEDRVANDTVVS